MMKQILLSGVIGLFLTLIGTPLLIKLLAKKGYGQYIRDDGPREHHSKRGTPTMGGIAFILATIIAYFLSKLITGYSVTFSGLLVLGLMAGMGLVGFLDDAKPDVVCLQELKCQDEGFPRAEIEAAKDTPPHTMVAHHNEKWRQRLRSPWACSPYTVLTTLAAFIAMFLMAQSFLTRQQDVKGCGMSYMRPTYSRFSNFDTEHTRFASKYSLYLYREGGLDEDTRACASL